MGTNYSNYNVVVQNALTSKRLILGVPKVPLYCFQI